MSASNAAAAAAVAAGRAGRRRGGAGGRRPVRAGRAGARHRRGVGTRSPGSCCCAGPGAPPEPTGNDRTSLVLSVGQPPGLAARRAGRVRRPRHQSDPAGVPADPGGMGEYVFLVDADGHLADPAIADVLAALIRRSALVRWLGSYPRVGGDNDVPAADIATTGRLRPGRASGRPLAARGVVLMRLMLIRHGQTPSNVLGLLDTAIPGPGLTDLGREQAAACRRTLDGQRVDADLRLHPAAVAADRRAAGGGPRARDVDSGRLLRGAPPVTWRCWATTDAVRTYLATIGAWMARRPRRSGCRVGGAARSVLDRFDAVVEPRRSRRAGRRAGDDGRPCWWGTARCCGCGRPPRHRRTAPSGSARSLPAVAQHRDDRRQSNGGRLADGVLGRAGPGRTRVGRPSRGRSGRRRPDRGGLSRRLRTPLTILKGMSEACRRTIDTVRPAPLPGRPSLRVALESRRHERGCRANHRHRQAGAPSGSTELASCPGRAAA